VERESFLEISNQVMKKIRSKEELSNEKIIQLAEDLIDLIAKKEGLTYIEVYAALEVTYLMISEQSYYASINPIKENSVSSSNKNG
jgi:hypothetical protein